MAHGTADAARRARVLHYDEDYERRMDRTARVAGPIPAVRSSGSCFAFHGGCGSGGAEVAASRRKRPSGRECQKATKYRHRAEVAHT